jgi:hypothetical protein
MKFLITLSLLFSTNIYSQQFSIREIKLKSKFDQNRPGNPTIIYPIVLTGDKTVNTLINTEIKKEILDIDGKYQTIYEALKENINEHNLTNLSYEITFKQQGILSINIFTEGCGAYCSSQTHYFNFNLKTGKQITIYDLIDKSKIDSFYRIVSRDKVNALEKYKKEEISELENKYIDSSGYNWIMEEVDRYCINSFKLEVFSILANEIEIIDPCEFPHVMKSQEPFYELKYSFKFILPLLNPRYRKLFSK